MFVVVDWVGGLYVLGIFRSIACLQGCQRTGGLVRTRTAIYPFYVNTKEMHERQTSKRTNSELRDREPFYEVSYE